MMRFRKRCARSKVLLVLIAVVIIAIVGMLSYIHTDLGIDDRLRSEVDRTLKEWAGDSGTSFAIKRAAIVKDAQPANNKDAQSANNKDAQSANNKDAQSVNNKDAQSANNKDAQSAINKEAQRAMVNEEQSQFHPSQLEQSQKSVFIDPALYVNSTNEIHRAHSILFWNPPGWLGNWFGDVDMQQCSYKNCKFDINKENFQKSSAVVFSIADLGMGYQPPVKPEQRNPDQAWIFFTLESPIHLGLQDFKSVHWQHALNWSWTFRTDADVFHPYGILQTRLPPVGKNYTEIYRRKSKMAAWAVSHCGAHSKRDMYAQLLNMNSIHVDIYGRCGNQYPSDFKKMLNRDYKFYLGFENSLCTDYVTEKFFNYFKSDLITVVRGGSDYKKYLPDGTYINAADFGSVRELAEFLTRLGNNEEEYIEYVKKKDRYSVKERDYMFREALCNICHKLNNLDRYRKSYGNILNWLGRCKEPNDLH